MDANKIDVIVLGAGIQGLAAANYLQSFAKKNVLLLEQYPIGHQRGNSSGQTNFPVVNPQYFSMFRQSINMWNQLQQQSTLTLFRETDSLTVGKDVNEFVTETNVKLSADQVNQKYGHIFECPSSHNAVFQPESIILFNQKCIQAYLSNFLNCGGIIRDQTKVLDLVVEKDGIFTVITEHGFKYSAKHIVLTMGPWTAPFLRSYLNLNVPVKCLRGQKCYWKARGDSRMAADCGTPAVVFIEPEGPYSLTPSLEYPGLVHFGVNDGGELVREPDFPEDKTFDPESQSTQTKSCKQLISKYNIQISKKPSFIENTIHQDSTDGKMIVDHHPIYQNIIFATGFNKNDLVFAPVIARIIGKMVLGELLENYENNFSCSRFPVYQSRL